MQLILGLDIGTQAVKGVLVTLDGKVAARAGLERPPMLPRPGWVEMDPERDWWGSGLQVVRQLLAQVGAGDSVIAAGVSALVPCLALLDAQMQPVRPAILYSDNRAIEELDWVNRTGGLNLTAEAVVPKLVWIQRREPGNFARGRVLLSAHNYIVQRLTGASAMDYDTAGIMGGIFDPKSKQWRTDLVERLGLDPALLPPLSPATGVVGRVTEEAARATGLPAGIPVIAGSGDTFPTLVGCGAVDVGDAMISFGTTGLLTVTLRPLVESAAGPHFGASEADAAVLWGANVLSVGRLIRWYLDQFPPAVPSGGNLYELMEQAAAAIPPGADGTLVLPHWLGRRTPLPDHNLRGSILGVLPSTTPGHVYRALMEAFAYNIRQGFDPVRERVRRVVLTAGGARSGLWRQIMADVLDHPVEYNPGGSGALGIAFLAAYALGHVTAFSDIRQRWLAGMERIDPRAEAVAVYQRLYPVYCQFDDVVAAPYASLAAALAATPAGE
ncbi:MAG: hypothetical protein HPY76_01310 [Anaerolineae bacterium]|nr:hypothetical protein [Anaerolineae bacterium]